MASLDGFPWHFGPVLWPALELADQLGPDRDHAHKQRNRRQRRGLFHKDPQHVRLPLVL